MWQRSCDPAPYAGAIIPYHALDRWDEFDVWARSDIAPTPDAERILGITNEQLAGCRPSEVALEDFSAFVGHPKAG